jgi:uncharacterized protein (TIGR02246 family)
MRFRVSVLVVALPLVGCTQSGDLQPLTTGAEVETVRTWFAEYNAAINAGVLERWAEFIADDAVIMPPDEPPIIGIEAIRPQYAAVFNAYSFDFRGGIEEITLAPPLAVVRASIEETLTPKNGDEPMEYRGAWLMILRQQPDGSWKLWRNMWSVFPPQPGGA